MLSEEEMSLEELIDIVIEKYIEEDIIRLDVSDTTKNRLKKDLTNQFKDEDFLYDIENSVNLISKDKIREKIKELVNKNVEVLGADRYEYAVRVLQELLEE